MRQYRHPEKGQARDIMQPTSACLGQQRMYAALAEISASNLVILLLPRYERVCCLAYLLRNVQLRRPVRNVVLTALHNMRDPLGYIFLGLIDYPQHLRLSLSYCPNHYEDINKADKQDSLPIWELVYLAYWIDFLTK